MIDTIRLIGCLLLILWGANALTDESAAVSRRFRISNLVIGLTIVAFGTSAPEFVISILSAIRGSSDLAIGNVVGSNIFNTLLIVGCTAIVAPISVGRTTLSREIPLCILSAVVLFVCANDALLDGESTNVISRSEGIILLGFFLIFLAYSFAIARKGSNTTTSNESPEEDTQSFPPMWKAVLFIILGLAALVGGGQLPFFQQLFHYQQR